MKWSCCRHWGRASLLAVGLWTAPLAFEPRLQAQPELPTLAQDQQERPQTLPTEQAPLPREADTAADTERPSKRPRAPAEPTAPPSILTDDYIPVGLSEALYLGNAQNPELMLARQRVTEALAERMHAAVQILPNIVYGGNFDDHTGPLQQSNGHILKVTRDATFFGLGAYTIAAGTINIPGIGYNFNPVLPFFAWPAVRALVRQRQFQCVAERNQALLRIALAYTDLLRAEGRRAIAIQTRNDVREVARITRVQAEESQARISDADRAASELSRRNALILEAENEILRASARLARELNADPSVRFHATDGWVVPVSIVPEPIPLRELVCIAMTRRPELAAQQQAIIQALKFLQAAKLLPLSPTVLAGFSTGTYGGGGVFHNPGYLQPAGFVQPQARFDTFGPRVDIDGIMYWSLRNMGIGNLAQIRQANSVMQQQQFRLGIILDRVRDEVAEAYAHTHARYAQIATSERGVRAGQIAFRLDKERTFNKQGLPIEVLDSLRLLADARYDYLDNIIAYNQAHFSLYVALGTPPCDVLARPVPGALVPPPADANLSPGGAGGARPPGAAPPVPQALPAPVAERQRREQETVMPVRYTERTPR